jgi:hypothetical protein
MPTHGCVTAHLRFAEPQSTRDHVYKHLARFKRLKGLGKAYGIAIGVSAQQDC